MNYVALDKAHLPHWWWHRWFCISPRTVLGPGRLQTGGIRCSSCGDNKSSSAHADGKQTCSWHASLLFSLVTLTSWYFQKESWVTSRRMLNCSDFYSIISAPWASLDDSIYHHISTVMAPDWLRKKNTSVFDLAIFSFHIFNIRECFYP